MQTKIKKAKFDLYLESQPEEQKLNQLPALAISEIVPMPSVDFRIEISEKQYIQALKESTAHAKSFIVVLIHMRNKQGKVRITDLHRYGVVAQIITKIKLPNGNFKVRLRILQRVKIQKFLQKEPF